MMPIVDKPDYRPAIIAAGLPGGSLRSLITAASPAASPVFHEFIRNLLLEEGGT